MMLFFFQRVIRNIIYKQSLIFHTMCEYNNIDLTSKKVLLSALIFGVFNAIYYIQTHDSLIVSIIGFGEMFPTNSCLWKCVLHYSSVIVFIIYSLYIMYWYCNISQMVFTMFWLIIILWSATSPKRKIICFIAEFFVSVSLTYASSTFNENYCKI